MEGSETRKMKENGSRPALWTKAFVMTTLANFFLFVSFQMLIPTLPVYVQENGGDEFAIGLVIGLFTVSALITRPFAGKFLDTVGRRKMLVAGLFIFILSIAGYSLTATVLLILGIRIIHGVGWGLSTTTFGTIVSDIVPAKRRGEGMGYFGLSTTLAMALAPLFGIWLMKAFGFSRLFWTAVGLAVIALLLSQTIVFPEPFRGAERKGKVPLWYGLIEKKALFPSMLVLLLGVTYGGIVGFITLFGREAGIDNVGWFFLGNALMVMIVRPLAGMVYDRKGHVWVLLPGGFFVLAGLLLLSYTTSMAMLLSASVLYGIGFGAVQPSLQAWVIDRVSPDRRGAATGTFFSAFDLGIGAGALLLGGIAKVANYAQMYRWSTVVVVLYVIVYAGYLYKMRRYG
ncbi:MFS transporter [Bacillaceae bacterium]